MDGVCSIRINKINKYEYVKEFETEDKCLPNCWIVIRLDGRGFHKFANLHGFEKPNDKRALELMSRAGAAVMEEFRDISLGFGQSDEYSFVFRKDTQLFSRRKDKLLTTVLSLFTSSYVFYWNNYFGFVKMLYPPAFDGRVVLFPTDTNLRDYLSWRQVDTHINNLYNTVFWALVLKKGLSPQQAEESLRGTVAAAKNEMLFKEFGVNYNNEPPLFRKGTVLVRKLVAATPPEPTGIRPNNKLRHVVIPLCCDIINDEFWNKNPEILGMKPIAVFNNSQNLPTFNGTKPNLKPTYQMPPPFEAVPPVVNDNMAFGDRQPSDDNMRDKSNDSEFRDRERRPSSEFSSRDRERSNTEFNFRDHERIS